MAKRDVATRAIWGDRVGGVVLRLTDEPQHTRVWATGAQGEEKLAEALAGVEGLNVLHDRRVPGTRGNIDHVVISSSGVFVVDAKMLKGRIDIRNRGWFFKTDLRLYVGSRDCSALAEKLTWQVEAVTTALEGARVEPMPPITPVLCFIDGEWPLLGRPKSYQGVRLESEGSLRRLVSEPRKLDTAVIDRITRLIADALASKTY